MNKRVMARIATAVLALSLLVVAASAASASNGKGKGKGHSDSGGHGKAHAVANSKMSFRLDDHNVAVGDPVTGPVRLFEPGSRGADILARLEHLTSRTQPVDRQIDLLQLEDPVDPARFGLGRHAGRVANIRKNARGYRGQMRKSSACRGAELFRSRGG